VRRELQDGHAKIIESAQLQRPFRDRDSIMVVPAIKATFHHLSQMFADAWLQRRVFRVRWEPLLAAFSDSCPSTNLCKMLATSV
jgi:hypothetical protein